MAQKKTTSHSVIITVTINVSAGIMMMYHLRKSWLGYSFMTKSIGVMLLPLKSAIFIISVMLANPKGNTYGEKEWPGYR